MQIFGSRKHEVTVNLRLDQEAVDFWRLTEHMGAATVLLNPPSTVIPRTDFTNLLYSHVGQFLLLFYGLS